MEPRWVEVNARGVRVENLRHFDGPWLAMELIRRLQLDEFLEQTLPTGSATIPWSPSALILVDRPFAGTLQRTVSRRAVVLQNCIAGPAGSSRSAH